MPLSILLIVYAIFMGLWAIVSVLIIIQLIHYAGSRPSAIMAIAVFISGSILILTLSGIALSAVDWQYTLPLFSNP